MISRAASFLRTVRGLQQLNLSLARGNVSRAARRIIPHDPMSWEFSGFSQNGEDGIIEVLLDHLREPNRYFVEIGASDGLENNTTWLSLVRRYSGLWIDADARASSNARTLFTRLNYGVAIEHVFVTQENADLVLRRSRVTDPDVFSLDIDSNDFYVARSLLKGGLRPKICVVEYNSAFGPSASVAAPYEEPLRARREEADKIYYGCSVTAWRSLFGGFGYRFVTVDGNGVNAFFANPRAFPSNFLETLRGRDFVENFAQLREYPAGWEAQFELIASRPLTAVIET